MKNFQPQVLFTALAIEILFGLFFVLISGGVGTVFMVGFLALFVGGGLFLLMRNGMFSTDWLNNQNQRLNNYQAGPTQPGGFYAGGQPAQPINFNPGGNTSFNLNLGLGINPGLERNEVFDQTYPIANEADTLQVEVNNGNLKVIGVADLKEVQLHAVKRVWENDELVARRELERLQVRFRQEDKRLLIEAGPVDLTGVNINLGKAPRIDLELKVPMALAANYSTNTGTLDLSELTGEIAARTTAGNMNISNISGGHDLTVGTSSGRVVLQQITAAMLRARATTGVLDLTAIGADGLELETMAGGVRVRGVNCGRLQALAQTGSLELADVHADNQLQLKATAGRIQTDNIQTPAFNIETTTGSIHYKGAGPTAPSQVLSGVGSTELIFAPGANFNLEARSSVGSVQVMLPVSNTLTANRNWFRGQIGAGGPTLNVASQVGSVRISQG
jgi:hypothetical protein